MTIDTTSSRILSRILLLALVGSVPLVLDVTGHRTAGSVAIAVILAGICVYAISGACRILRRPA